MSLVRKIISGIRRKRVLPIVGTSVLSFAIVVSALVSGFAVQPKLAHASCDPRVIDGNPVTPPYPPLIQPITAPTGTYTDPGNIPIHITGHGGYECQGDPNGGLGWEAVDVTVVYSITDDLTSNEVFSGSWSAVRCQVPICLPRTIQVDSSAPASSWQAGHYTLSAFAVGAGTEEPVGPVLAHFIIERNNNNPGRLVITPPAGAVNNTMTVSGTGTGGDWARGRVHCSDGTNAYGDFRQALATANTGLIGGPVEYHNSYGAGAYPTHHSISLPNYPPKYQIDGTDAGTYTLQLDDQGIDQPVNCDAVGSYTAAQYSFNFSVNTAALSEGAHTLTVKAWDESTESEISSTINFTVQHGLVCNTSQQIVNAGSPATYSLTIGSQNGFSGQAVIRVSAGLPPGASSSPETVNIPAGGTAGALVTVTTAANAPASTSTLTFEARAPGMPTQNCTSNLIIRNNSGAPQVALSATPLIVPVGATSTPFWTISGGEPTSCALSANPRLAGWSRTISGSQVTVGAHTGEPLGINATTTLSIDCSNSFGNSTASVTIGIGTASLTVLPPSITITTGGVGVFTAMYDADGSAGPIAPQDVTVPASWNAVDPNIANVTGYGAFTGTRSGTTVINASYAGVSGSAELVVGGPTCSPADQTISEGGTASFTASGGNGIYSWQAPGGNPASGNGSRFSTSYASTNVYNVTVNGSAPCLVHVLPGGSPTLNLIPTAMQIAVRGVAAFSAKYDPDGSGPQVSSDVTNAAAWQVDSGNTVVRSQGQGNFFGLTNGNASISAGYRGLTAPGTVTVGGGSCTFTANPGTLFIPPRRATTLNWNCAPIVRTSCTVKVGAGTGNPDPRAGTLITSGGASGTGQDSPAYTTSYHLSCTGGIEQDVTVRVFDVTTRIEIRP